MKSDKEFKNDDKKFKVVIFIGSDHEQEKQQLKEYIETNNVADDVRIISDTNDENKNVDQIKLASLNLQNSTDENTIFIIWAHGDNIVKNGKNFHIVQIATDKSVDGIIATAQFLEELQESLTNDLSAILFSCHSGGVLKREEISLDKFTNNISLIARSGNKYTTDVKENLNQTLNIIDLKTGIKGNLTNEELFQILPENESETLYVKDKTNQKASKLSRIGKFTAQEIKELLANSHTGFTSDQQTQIYDSLLKSGKKDFSLSAVSKLISNLYAETENNIRLSQLLKNKLKEKLSPIGIKNFLENRTNKESKSQELNDDNLNEYALKVLFLAIRRNDLDLIKAIIFQYDIVNQTDKDGNNPIISAIANEKSLEIIDILINAGGNINLTSKRTSPLILAIYQRPEIIRMLLDANADPNLVVDGLSPLLTAIYRRPGVVKMLLDAKADPNSTDDYGTPALSIAIRENKKEVIEILVNDKNTDLNKADDDGNTPLMFAVLYNQPQTVRLLIAKGAKFDPNNEKDMDSLRIAKEKGFKETVEIIEKTSKGVPQPKKGLLNRVLPSLRIILREDKIEKPTLSPQPKDVSTIEIEQKEPTLS